MAAVTRPSRTTRADDPLGAAKEALGPEPPAPPIFELSRQRPRPDTQAPKAIFREGSTPRRLESTYTALLRAKLHCKTVDGTIRLRPQPDP